MRKQLFAANWKMYKTPAEAVTFFQTFLQLLSAREETETAVFPSMTSLPAAVEIARNTPVAIGAQTMHWLDSGAFTGETSPTMLLAVGCTHVLIGHSERRQNFNETDQTVNLKLKSALAHKLTPILCVGERLEERQDHKTEEVLNRQVASALDGISPEEAAPIILAYEPIWAIGTGQTANPQIAEEAHKIIRTRIAESLNTEVANATRILYGGSVKPENASGLCCIEDVDGALVGGASLDPHSFADIIHAAERSR